MFLTQVITILWTLFCYVEGRGLLILYRPRDVSTDCAFSENLRYDLSFGMGMSDTITLIFRTMSEVDYECGVEIVTESNSNVYLLVVIRFPNNIGFNCMLNPNAFTVLKKKDCLRICDETSYRNVYSPYFTISAKAGRLRFRFASNSSINSDMNADMYEVTATSARIKGNQSCDLINETICVMDHKEFCFTSGVVCDGIKNCGVSDCFDERKSDCRLPVHHLGYTPVIAVTAAIICALLAATHVLLQCLPPTANSFFIFNTNEDNRLCIDPVFKYPAERSFEEKRDKRKSLIPVFSSSSSDEHSENNPQTDVPVNELQIMNVPTGLPATDEHDKPERRKTTIKSMTAKVQEKLKLVAGRSRAISKLEDQQKTFDI